MRVFLAGASGVIGRRLVPLLVERGHSVTGMTRSPEKADLLRRLGAVPVVCDVFDFEALRVAVVEACPDLVLHQLTDLPDDPARIREFGETNARIRTEGTKNLLDAMDVAGGARLLAQSIAWTVPAGAAAVEVMEKLVHDANGVVLRYGQFYGPDTYHELEPPEGPRIQIDAAARRTVEVLAMRGPATLEVVDD